MALEREKCRAIHFGEHSVARTLFAFSFYFASTFLGASAFAEYTFEDAAIAKKIASQKCSKCHGDDGLGVNEEYASLAGQPSEYLIKQLFNFKTGQRKHVRMQSVAEKLPLQDLLRVSEYFSRMAPGVRPNTDEKLVAQGRALYFGGSPETGSSNCVSCHGVYATGGASVPRLAGQNPAYLERQLRHLIERSRKNDRSMHYVNSTLTDDQIRSVAAYLAGEE